MEDFGRTYVWVIFDLKMNAVIGVFRDKEEAEKYAEQYCTLFKVEYHVIN